LGAPRSAYDTHRGDAGRHRRGRRSRGANALTVLVRRGKLTEDERQTGLGWFRALPLRVDYEMASLAFSKLADLASAYQLSVYDAAYLELVQRRKLVLGCKDGPLRKAAKRCGVRVWE